MKDGNKDVGLHLVFPPMVCGLVEVALANRQNLGMWRCGFYSRTVCGVSFYVRRIEDDEHQYQRLKIKYRVCNYIPGRFLLLFLSFLFYGVPYECFLVLVASVQAVNTF